LTSEKEAEAGGKMATKTRRWLRISSFRKMGKKEPLFKSVEGIFGSQGFRAAAQDLTLGEEKRTASSRGETDSGQASIKDSGVKSYH